MKFLKKLALVCFSFIFSTGITYSATFQDVSPSHDHSIAIQYLFSQGIMKGYSNNEFKPEQLITRAEALKVIWEGGQMEKAQNWETLPFSDIGNESWETPYVVAAYDRGIVSAGDGQFYSGRTIVTAEFLKMLLLTNGFVQENWENKVLFNDVSSDDWFAPFMNYAGHAGIVSKDSENNVNPSREPTRGDIAEMMYLLTVIQNAKNTDFLIQQAQIQMDAIKTFKSSGKLEIAKRTAELSVDMTQQAYKNRPTDMVVLGEAKLAKAYYYVLMSYIAAYQNEKENATDLANQSIVKASEAQQADSALQSEAGLIKNEATEIIERVSLI